MHGSVMGATERIYNRLVMKSLFAIRFFVPLVLLVVSVSMAYGGGWTQKEGKGYFKLETRFLRASSSYDSTGALVSMPTYGDVTLGFYGEYGITDLVTGVVSIPFYKHLTRNRQVDAVSGIESAPGASESGLADADLGVRIGITQAGPTVLSAAVTLGVPLGVVMPMSGLATGDGEINTTMALQAGHSFYPVPMYAAADLGLNGRSRGYADQFLYGFEVGYTFVDAVTVILRTNGLHSLNNGSGGGDSPGPYSNNQSYLSYGSEVLYSPGGGFGVSAGFQSATLARNTLAAPTYSIGVFFKM